MPGHRALAGFAALAFVLGLSSGCGGDPTLVVGGEAASMAPAVSGARVVWEDDRNSVIDDLTGEEIADGVDVYMRDMGAAGGLVKVAGGPGDQEAPVVSGNWVAWEDAGDIRARDLTTGAVVTVSAAVEEQYDAAACGSVVVWTDNRTGDPDIYARDLAGGAEVVVATGPTIQAYPDCDGRRIVYAAYGQVSMDVHLYDLDTGQTIVVTDRVWHERFPAISGDWVVWQEWAPDTGQGSTQDIRAKNVVTGQTLTVSAASGDQIEPDVAGTWVVWEDQRGIAPDVWTRNLATMSSESNATSGPGRQDEPAISGNRVVYDDDQANSWDVRTFLL